MTEERWQTQKSRLLWFVVIVVTWVKGWEINECVSFIAHRSARLVLWCDTTALFSFALLGWWYSRQLFEQCWWATFGKCCSQRANRWDKGPMTDLKYQNRNVLPILNGKVPKQCCSKKLPHVSLIKVPKSFCVCVLPYKNHLVSPKYLNQQFLK